LLKPLNILKIIIKDDAPIAIPIIDKIFINEIN
jgi:hypothetical protein